MKKILSPSIQGTRLSQGERLERARIEAGYKNKSDAARAIGIGVTTYINHENGSAPLTRAGERYARFFKVSFEWLMHGRGPMRPGQHPLEVHGIVGAGAAVFPFDDETSPIDYVQMPLATDLSVFLVRGDSQYPRYLDGEYILVERIARQPEQLIGAYAVVLLEDGRRLIKIIRNSSVQGSFRIESHNAPPEDDVRIVKAWRVRGTLDT